MFPFQEYYLILIFPIFIAAQDWAAATCNFTVPGE
jgi:hypothetical protein